SAQQVVKLGEGETLTISGFISPRSLNSVALMKPLIVSVSPSPSFTTCCAEVARAPPSTRTAATTDAENDSIGLLMTPPLQGKGGPIRTLSLDYPFTAPIVKPWMKRSMNAL